MSSTIQTNECLPLTSSLKIEPYNSCQDVEESIRIPPIAKKEKKASDWTGKTIRSIKWFKLGTKIASVTCKLTNHIPIARQITLARMTFSLTLASIAVFSGKSSLIGSSRALKKAIKLLKKEKVKADFDKKTQTITIASQNIRTTHYMLWYLKTMLFSLGSKGRKILAQTVVKHGRLLLVPPCMLAQIYLWHKYSNDGFFDYWGHRKITCDTSDTLTNVALAITYGTPLTLFFLRKTRSLVALMATLKPLKKLQKIATLPRLVAMKNLAIIAKAPLRLGGLVSSLCNRLIFACRTAVQGYKNSAECSDTFFASRVIALANIVPQTLRYIGRLLSK